VLLLAVLSWKTLFTWTVRRFERQFYWQIIGCFYVLIFVVGLVRLLDNHVLCLWFGSAVGQPCALPVVWFGCWTIVCCACGLVRLLENRVLCLWFGSAVGQSCAPPVVWWSHWWIHWIVNAGLTCGVCRLTVTIVTGLFRAYIASGRLSGILH
jgi:hypothetical protein